MNSNSDLICIEDEYEENYQVLDFKLNSYNRKHYESIIKDYRSQGRLLVGANFQAEIPELDLEDEREVKLSTSKYSFSQMPTISSKFSAEFYRIEKIWDKSTKCNLCLLIFHLNQNFKRANLRFEPIPQSNLGPKWSRKGKKLITLAKILRVVYLYGENEVIKEAERQPKALYEYLLNITL